MGLERFHMRCGSDVYFTIMSQKDQKLQQQQLSMKIVWH